MILAAKQIGEANCERAAWYARYMRELERRGDHDLKMDQAMDDFNGYVFQWTWDEQAQKDRKSWLLPSGCVTFSREQAIQEWSNA